MTVSLLSQIKCHYAGGCDLTAAAAAAAVACYNGQCDLLSANATALVLQHSQQQQVSCLHVVRHQLLQQQPLRQR
jgi:predicted glycosyltransferase